MCDEVSPVPKALSRLCSKDLNIGFLLSDKSHVPDHGLSGEGLSICPVKVLQDEGRDAQEC